MTDKMPVFMPGRLKYKTGSVLIPDAGGHRIIVNICNVDGEWNSPNVLELSKRWKKTEDEYRRWFRSQVNFKLGEIQEVCVQSDTSVVNLLAVNYKQLDPDNKIPFRYSALELCLEKLAKIAKENGSSVHIPRSSYGLEGSSWNETEKIIIDKLINQKLNVTIYTHIIKKD